MNYGLLGDNLPPPSATISFLKSKNISRIRIFEPNEQVLQALHNTGIEVVVGTLNQDLQPLAADVSFAFRWVQSNVIPHANTVKFRYVTAGNEVIPSSMQNFVFPAMQNLKTALQASQLPYHIPVTTVIATSVLGASFPPSSGAFSDETAPSLSQIATFLSENRAPLLVNVYPYFAYIFNQKDISLPYALFNTNEVVVRDGVFEYRNLFDSITDAVFAALEKVGGGSVEIVVAESGWPSKGNGDIATVENAKMYNNNLIRHVLGNSGTPRRPGTSIEAYVFGLFNENLKPAGTEQSFGLFYPDMTEVYHVNFAGI